MGFLAGVAATARGFAWKPEVERLMNIFRKTASIRLPIGSAANRFVPVAEL